MATSLNLAWVDVTSAGLTTATTAYSDGDLYGSESFLILPGSIQFANLEAVCVTDESDIISAVDIYFAEAAFSFGTDNVAPSPSDGNAALNRMKVSLPAAEDLGGVRKAYIDSLGIPLYAAVGATGVAFRAVGRNAGHTFFGATTSLKYHFGFLKDV